MQKTLGMILKMLVALTGMKFQLVRSKAIFFFSEQLVYRIYYKTMSKNVLKILEKLILKYGCLLETKDSLPNKSGSHVGLYLSMQLQKLMIERIALLHHICNSEFKNQMALLKLKKKHQEAN